MSEQWIEGRFEGTYAGNRVVGVPALRGEKRFHLEVQGGVVRGVAPVAPPAIESAADGENRREIRQPRLSDVAIACDTEPGGERIATLYDVRIVDFRLRHPAEVRGRALGTVRGTIRARLTPPPPLAREVDVASTPVGSGPVMAKVHRASRHGTVAETNAAYYARTLWWTALVGLVAGSLGLALACGKSTAGLWLGPLLAALVIRRALKQFAIGHTKTGHALGVALLGAQAFWLLEPATIGGAFGCSAPIEGHLAWLAAPIFVAALVRLRWPLILTAGVWTVVLCTGCAEIGGAGTSTSPTESAESPVPLARTDAQGRWPAMPRDWMADLPSLGHLAGLIGSTRIADGRTGPDTVSERQGVPSQRLLHDDALPNPERETAFPATNSQGAPGPMRSDASHSPADSSETAGHAGAAIGNDATRGPGSVDPTLSPPRAAERLGPQGTPLPRVSGPDAAPSRAGATASARPAVPTATGGGWVALDHRRAERDLVRISLEHANRMPESFFDSGGARRVYLPTDPIFEPGGSQIRSQGALQLSRLAALLSASPGQRVVIDVHTDAGGSAEAQQGLSERRAEGVRRWLLDRGHLAAEQIEVRGVGGVHPLVPPDGSYAAQQPNRRLEVRLTE